MQPTIFTLVLSLTDLLTENCEGKKSLEFQNYLVFINLNKKNKTIKIHFIRLY